MRIGGGHPTSVEELELQHRDDQASDGAQQLLEEAADVVADQTDVVVPGVTQPGGVLPPSLDGVELVDVDDD